MKRHLKLANLPEWFRWSDGRAFTRAELQKFNAIRKKTKRKDEHERAWFYRIRAVVEQYEHRKASTVVKRPGPLARAWAWVRGKQAPTKVVTQV